MKISVVAYRCHLVVAGDDRRAVCEHARVAGDAAGWKRLGARNAKRGTQNAERLDASKDATQVGSFSTGRSPHLYSEKNDGSTAHSHDLSRVTNKFCQNIGKTRSGDIQIQTLRTTCAGHEYLARALPMIQA